MVKIDDFITVLKEGVKKETKKNKSDKNIQRKRKSMMWSQENEGLEAPKKRLLKMKKLMKVEKNQWVRLQTLTFFK